MSGNPSRGCGTKSEGSCYGEGPDSSKGGILRMWSWVLGDGHTDVIPLDIPPLVMVICNPAGTLAARELVKHREPVFSMSPILGADYDVNAAYKRLLEKTKKIGVADHVGKDNYSVYSFARETEWHGPSRKIPPQLAKELAQIIWTTGPIPMLFTHDWMPVFNDHYHLEQAVDIVAKCYEDTAPIDPDGMEWVPTWEMSGWSQYITTPDDGGNHILLPILSLMHELERNWKAHADDPRYMDAREFFRTVRRMEQPIGLSWLGKVTYTADKEGEFSDQAQEQMDSFSDVVINFLNLNETEQE